MHGNEGCEMTSDIRILNWCIKTDVGLKVFLFK